MHLETDPPKVVIEDATERLRIQHAIAVAPYSPDFNAIGAYEEMTSGNEFPYELNTRLSSLALKGLATLQSIEDSIGYNMVTSLPPRKRFVFNPLVALRRARERRFQRAHPLPPTSN